MERKKSAQSANNLHVVMSPKQEQSVFDQSFDIFFDFLFLSKSKNYNDLFRTAKQGDVPMGGYLTWIM